MENTYTKVKVTDTEEKTAKNGTKYLSVKVEGGKSYSCWEPTLFWNFQKSGEVELEVIVQKNGNFENIVGIKGVDYMPSKTGTSRIEKAMNRKDATITKFADRKENSMTRFAIMRDSAMFAVASFQKDAEGKNLQEWHEHWKVYFEAEYS